MRTAANCTIAPLSGDHEKQQQEKKRSKWVELWVEYLIIHFTHREKWTEVQIKKKQTNTGREWQEA